MPRVIDKLNDLNKRLLLYPKLLYVSIALFFYTLHTYRSQFVAQMYGIEKKYWGLYMCIPQIVSLVFGINAAAFVDRLGIQKFILTGSIAVAVAIFTIFFFVKQFVVFLLLFTVYFSCVSITLPLIDKVVMEYLDKTEGVEISYYGRQRAFAPIGYVASCYILDYIIGTSTTNKKTTYDFSKLLPYEWLTGGIALCAILLFVSNLPRRDVASRSNLRLFTKLFKNSEFMFFIFLIFLNGITRASMTNYINVYYDDHLEFNRDDKKATNLTFYQSLHNGRKKASAVLAGNVTELLMYFLSVPIISRFGLLIPVFVSQIAQLLRFVGYYFQDTESKFRFETVLVLELLKGINFGLIQFSAATLAMKLVRPSMKSTAQLVYNGTFIALGSIAAGIGFLVVFNAHKSTGGIIPAAAYKQVFLIDGLLTVLCIGLMLFKYQLRDNALFNVERFNNKLDRIEIEEVDNVDTKMAEETKEPTNDLKNVQIKEI